MTRDAKGFYKLWYVSHGHPSHSTFREHFRFQCTVFEYNKLARLDLEALRNILCGFWVVLVVAWILKLGLRYTSRTCPCSWLRGTFSADVYQHYV